MVRTLSPDSGRWTVVNPTALPRAQCPTFADMVRQGIAIVVTIVALLSACSLRDDDPGSTNPAADVAAQQPDQHGRRSTGPTDPTRTTTTTDVDRSQPLPAITTIAVAHRGAFTSTITENGIPALQNASRLGAEMVEFDVRPTLDGELIAMHDGGLVRTTDCLGQVWGRSLADIQASCRLSDGSTVPTLREFLDYSVTRKLPLMIELKEGPGWTPELFAEMRASMEPLSGFGGSVFLSFDERLLALARDAIPELPGVWIVPRRLSMSTSVHAMPVDGLLVDGELTTEAWMRDARRHDKLVYSRVVDTAQGWQRCADIGIDGILTNRLAAFLKWRATADS